MSYPAEYSVSPYPGWVRRVDRLSRPVTGEDIRTLSQDMDISTRETPAGTVHIIHKFGLAEINCIVGEQEVEVWYDPKKRSFTEEYLEALLRTRF